MEHVAFNPDFINVISELFPPVIQKELTIFIDDDPTIELNFILDYVRNLRLKSQALLTKKSYNLKPDTMDLRKQKSRGGKSGEFIPTSAVSYNPARRDEKCRICVTLDAEVDTEDLYEDHYHSVATGCPRFAAMPRSKKIRMVEKAKLCPNCLDEKFIRSKTNQNHNNCPVKSKIFFFTCNEKECKKHFWICSSHEKFNAPKLKKSTNYWNERGKVFVNIAQVFKVTS